MAFFCQANCWNQVGSQARLEHIAKSARFEGGATRILILLNREENNFGGSVGPEYAFGRFHSVKNGHRAVEHDYIRKQLSSGANSRFPVHYHANDFAPVARYESTDIADDLNVVVSKR